VCVVRHFCLLFVFFIVSKERVTKKLKQCKKREITVLFRKKFATYE
jgi:hypothetical protein